MNTWQVVGVVCLALAAIALLSASSSEIDNEISPSTDAATAAIVSGAERAPYRLEPAPRDSYLPV